MNDEPMSDEEFEPYSKLCGLSDKHLANYLREVVSETEVKNLEIIMTILITTVLKGLEPNIGMDKTVDLIGAIYAEMLELQAEKNGTPIVKN